MRVVIDTNVFVSSFFGGLPRKVLDLFRDGALTLCLSGAILDEYAEVLSRLGLAQGPELTELLSFLAHAQNTLFVADPQPVRAIPEDPDDDKFVACALALDAPCVVTGDKAMLAVARFHQVRILSPREFLELSGRSVTFP